MEEKTKKSIIPGTKLALNNTQLLVSSGIPSLDDLIGGGLAVGSVLLIEEDACGIYSKVMLRYFLAEGMVNGHSLYIASQDYNPTSFIKTLPAVIPNDVQEVPKNDISDDKLTIAWRYQHMKMNQSKLPSLSFGHYYDLTKSMDQKMVDETDISFWSGQIGLNPAVLTFKNPAYHDLLEHIKHEIDSKKFSLTSTQPKRNILRIALHSLGSPLWLPNGEYSFSSHQRDLDMFLYCLRALARSALVVIAVTIPSKIINEGSVSRCIHSSDLAIRLESFAGTELEKIECLSDFQGFFKFVKFPTINTLQSKDPGPSDFAFKMRRKKFTIGLLHLPPDVQDAVENEIPSMGCGSSTKHLLEF